MKAEALHPGRDRQKAAFASTKAHFRLGQNAVRDGDDEAAAAHFQAQIRHTPDHYEAWLHLGKAFKRLKRFAEAKMAFTVIVSRVRSSDPALELSRLAVRQLDYDQAEEMARLALERDPNKSQIKAQLESIAAAREVEHFRLGVRAASDGDSDAAVAHFQAQIVRTPDHYEAWLHLGKAFKRLKRFSEAEETFAKILRDGQSSDPALELSRLAVLQLDYDRAEEMARLALERDPRQNQIKAQLETIAAAREVEHFRLGIRAASDGDSDAAVAHFQAQIARTPDHYEAWLHLGKAFKRLKRFSEAEETFAKILRDGQSSDPALELSRLAVLQLDYDRAEEMARLALEWDPRQSEVQAQLVRILLRKNQLSEAEGHAKVLIQSARNSVLGHTCLAVCAYTAGGFEKGNEHFDKACDVAGRVKDGFRTIAGILKDFPIPEAVIRFIDAASKVHLNVIDAPLWDVKARYMQQQGEPEAATLAYVQSILASPGRWGRYLDVARLLSGIAQRKARNDVITTPERELALDFLGAAYAAQRKEPRVLSALFDHYLKARNYDKAWRYLSELELVQKDPQQTEVYKTRFFLAQAHWWEALQVVERLEEDPAPSPQTWRSIAKAWEVFGAASLQEAALQKAVNLAEAPPDLLTQHSRALYELGCFHQAREGHRQAAALAKEKSQKIGDLASLDELLKDATAEPARIFSEAATLRPSTFADGWTHWSVRWQDEDWGLFAYGDRAGEDGAAIASAMLAEMRPAIGYVYAEAAERPARAADAFMMRVPDPQTCGLFLFRQADLGHLATPLATENAPALLRRAMGRLNGQFAPNITAAPPLPNGAAPRLGGDEPEKADAGFLLSAGETQALLARGADALRAAILEAEAHAVIFTRQTAWAVDAVADCRINRILDLDRVPEAGDLPDAAIARFDRIAPRTPEAQAWLEDACRISSAIVEDVEAAAKEDHLCGHGDVLIVVGAGIGNVLQAAPLIRRISETLGHQVDVLLRSGVPVVAELFSNSPYVRHAFTATDRARDISYRRGLITQSAGAVIPFINAARFLVQRRSFDMFDRCRFIHEAEFNFLGADRLFPELAAQDIREDARKDAMPGPFVRQFRMEDWTPAKRAGGAPVIGLVSSVPAEALFAIRSWPHYPELVARMRAQGWEVRSFGLPPEFIEGSVNRTGIPFRDMIAEVAECDVFVTTDTGAFHVAEALGVPTVVLWGPSSTVKNGPLSPRTLQLFSERPCAPCQFKLDFLNCDDPVCMQDHSVDQVVEAVRTQLETPGATFSARTERYRQHEADGLPSPFRAEFRDRYSQLSGAVLSDVADLFERFQNGHIATGRLDRAREVLDRFPPVQRSAGARRLLQARLDFENKAYEEALASLENGEKDLTGLDLALWMELKAKSLRRLHRFAELAQMWSDPPAGMRDAMASRPNAAVAMLKNVAFGLARRSAFAEAEAALRLGLEVAPSAEGDLVPRLEQLRDDIGRHIGKRSPLIHPDRVKWAVVSDDPQDLTLAPLPREQVELFWYRPDEIEALDRDRPSLDVVSDATGPGPAAHHVPSRDLRLSDWREVADLFVGAAPPPARKRIAVFCHHHPFRWNPRGGERSTRTIAKALQDDGYDVLFLVENKKNTDTFCEIYEDCAIILCGEMRFKDACLGAIACWRPDFAIMYGETSVRSSEACREAGLDYIMYPRDWGEITRAAPQNLIAVSPTDEDAITPAYRALYAGAWRIITNCDYAGEIVRHFYDAPSETAYVPVEWPQSPDQYDPEGPVLLINPAKGGGRALLQALAERMPDTAFRVIGGKAGEFPSNVDVRPFHDGPYEDMYQGVSLTLFPFGGMEACGTGRVVLEAFHCGVPVLASKSGGIPEAVPDPWLISDDTNIQEWVDGIRRVLAAGVRELDPRTLLEPFLPESSLEVSRRAVSEYFDGQGRIDPQIQTQSGQ